MSSTVRFVLCGWLALMGCGAAVIVSSHISWQAGYSQALFDLAE